MRKKRAELKSKLKETEKDTADLKEFFQSIKEKYQAQSNEKQFLIDKIKSENEKLLSSIKGMVAVRSEFGDIIQSVGCCSEELFSHLYGPSQDFSALNAIFSLRSKERSTSGRVCSLKSEKRSQHSISLSPLSPS
jgi:predicted nuclease with TOPRIM domain